MAEVSFLDNQVCFAMYSATNAMIRQYRPLLQEYDLTYPQFIVLLALYEQDNVMLSEIGQKTFFDSGTLTPIIKKLEEKQFLKRVAVKEDERMKKVILLEKALASKDEITLIPFKLACSLGMNPNDLVAIHNLCHRFLKGLEQSKLESLEN
ncbi:MarR family winged helix-turn-helix transcriptional regulator [Acinetobacter proteolyticus]|uniref:MarR family winged helix-turn-helix transcriptional regulator n=1 Tax=Acinetobacter proteolyticus TaxID=1776741 RepID=UPI0031E2CBC4